MSTGNNNETPGSSRRVDEVEEQMDDDLSNHYLQFLCAPPETQAQTNVEESEYDAEDDQGVEDTDEVSDDDETTTSGAGEGSDAAAKAERARQRKERRLKKVTALRQKII